MKSTEDSAAINTFWSLGGKELDKRTTHFSPFSPGTFGYWNAPTIEMEKQKKTKKKDSNKRRSNLKYLDYIYIYI